MLIDMLEYYQMIKKLNINIIYSGPIWSDGIECIGSTLRKRLEFNEMPICTSQSIFSIFVEQMNNMLMYSAEKEMIENDSNHLNASKGIFILGAQDKTYFVQSGNVIKSSDVDLIRDRIDYLNTLDKPGLRQFYKQQMKNGDTNLQSKGAGLGLIEIARRASSKIEYRFTPLEDDLIFFTIYVTIQ